MKRLTAYLVGVALLSLGALVSLHARAQVTDKPILKVPTDLSLVAFEINEQGACAVWWARDTDDRYGDWHLDRAFCRGTHCMGISKDIAKMILARTVNVTDADVAACTAKLPPRPKARWIVAAAVPVGGTLPVYTLKADGTRDPLSTERVTSFITAQGKTVPRWCRCTVRSKEPSAWSSTYCKFADDNPMNAIDKPTRVVRCREQAG